MIRFVHKGKLTRTYRFLERAKELFKRSEFDKYGKLGVEALAAATPVDTGKTAESWVYDIEHRRGYTKISWSNTNINDGVIIAILLQYGHGTGTGAYVYGVDYINPAMAPVFEKIAEDAWKEVVSA